MRKKNLLVLLVVGVLFVFAIPGYAALLTYELNFVYDGTAPAGSLPWLTAVFDDADDDADAGAVRLTMEATGLTGSEKVGKWVFNADGDASFFSDLDIIYVNSNTDPFPPIQGWRWAPAQPPINAGPAHGFDIEFDFLTNGDNFGQGDWIVFDLMVAGLDLTVDYFDDLNTSGPMFATAAHVQSIGQALESGWIAPNSSSVPEPATMLFLGLGLVCLAGIGRRRFK